MFVDRARIKATWAIALELLDCALRHLKTLETDVKAYAPYVNLHPDGLFREGPERKLEFRKFIARTDPA